MEKYLEKSDQPQPLEEANAGSLHSERCTLIAPLPELPGSMHQLEAAAMARKSGGGGVSSSSSSSSSGGAPPLSPIAVVHTAGNEGDNLQSEKTRRPQRLKANSEIVIAAPRKEFSETITSTTTEAQFLSEVGWRAVRVGRSSSTDSAPRVGFFHEVTGDYVMLDVEFHALEEMFKQFAKGGSLSIGDVKRMQEEALREEFKKLDGDHSGTLEQGEIRELMASLGKKLDRMQLTEVMKQLDLSGDGHVDFDEFKTWWYKTDYGSEDYEWERDRELQDLFAEVDTDSSGFVDWIEFATMIGNKIRRSKSVVFEYRERKAINMIRLALDNVRKDIRAIYGTKKRGQSVHWIAQEVLRKGIRKRCFFRPDGDGCGFYFRMTWDIVQVFLLMYVAITIPLRIGFERQEWSDPQTGWFWFELLVDIYFWIDIVINFRTAYRVGDDPSMELIIDPRLIAKRYLKGWFPIDLVSCLPISYLELLAVHLDDSSGRRFLQNEFHQKSTASNVKIFKTLRLLRLAKLLRLARVNRLLDRLQQEVEGLAAVTKMVKIISVILFVSHGVSCIWYACGTSDQILPGPSQTLLQGWVHRQGWDAEVGLGTRYLDSLYYSLTTITTVGYGDRTPHTDVEKVLSIMFELCGAAIFGVISGSLGTLAMSESLVKSEQKLITQELDEFMKVRRLDKELRREIKDQLTHWLQEMTNFDEEKILGRLPPKLRKRVYMNIYSRHLKACPLLEGVTESVVVMLVTRMRPYLAIKGDAIFQEGDVGHEMYLVLDGEIALSSHQVPSYGARNWYAGAFFGELPVLGIGTGQLRNLHVYTATSVEKSYCSYLTQHVLDEIHEQSPEFKSHMRRLATKRAARFSHADVDVANTKSSNEFGGLSPPQSPSQPRSQEEPYSMKAIEKQIASKLERQISAELASKRNSEFAAKFPVQSVEVGAVASEVSIMREDVAKLTEKVDTLSESVTEIASLIRAELVSQ